MMNEWDDRARAPAPGGRWHEQLLLTAVVAIVMIALVAGFLSR